jgi:hypothetical protein
VPVICSEQSINGMAKMMVWLFGISVSGNIPLVLVFCMKEFEQHEKVIRRP